MQAFFCSMESQAQKGKPAVCIRSGVSHRPIELLLSGGLSNEAQAVVNDREVEMGIGQVGVVGQGFLKRRNGFFEPSCVGQGRPEVEVSLSERRVDGDRLLVGVNFLGLAPHLTVYDTQVDVGPGVTGVLGQGGAQVGHRFLITLKAMESHPSVDKRFGVAGLLG